MGRRSASEPPPGDRPGQDTRTRSRPIFHQGTSSRSGGNAQRSLCLKTLTSTFKLGWWTEEERREAGAGQLSLSVIHEPHTGPFIRPELTLVAAQRFTGAPAWAHLFPPSYLKRPLASALEGKYVHIWQTLFEKSACSQRGGCVFGQDQRLCAGGAVAASLLVICWPENMNSDALSCTLRPTEAVRLGLFAPGESVLR